eukprot:scaffold1675_cov361-Prasinococcus_capsulatus_cf.AAC.1
MRTDDVLLQAFSTRVQLPASASPTVWPWHLPGHLVCTNRPGLPTAVLAVDGGDDVDRTHREAVGVRVVVPWAAAARRPTSALGPARGARAGEPLPVGGGALRYASVRARARAAPPPNTRRPATPRARPHVRAARHSEAPRCVIGAMTEPISPPRIDPRPRLRIPESKLGVSYISSRVSRAQGWSGSSSPGQAETYP